MDYIIVRHNYTFTHENMYMYNIHNTLFKYFSLQHELSPQKFMVIFHDIFHDFRD